MAANSSAIAMTAFQVSRAVIPALAVATVDASLDLAVRYGSERSLYGGRVLDIPHARALLAGAIADFLVADALSAVVVRALHLAPADCLVLTAVSKSLVPQLLTSAMDDLSVLFGSTFYARVPPYDVFEKFLRDLAVVPIGHAGSTACLLTILPNLPAWLRRSRRTEATDPALFRLGDDLDELAFDRLALGAGAGDPLGAALRDPAIRAGFGSGADAPPEAFAAAHRLTLALAAGAWAGVCAENADSTLTGDPLVRLAGLQRVEARLRGGPIVPLDPTAVDRLMEVADDLVARDVRFAPSARDDSPHSATWKEDAP